MQKIKFWTKIKFWISECTWLKFSIISMRRPGLRIADAKNVLIIIISIHSNIHPNVVTNILCIIVWGNDNSWYYSNSVPEKWPEVFNQKWPEKVTRSWPDIFLYKLYSQITVSHIFIFHYQKLPKKSVLVTLVFDQRLTRLKKC